MGNTHCITVKSSFLHLMNSLELKLKYSSRLELVYTFCEFLVEFSRINNYTSQKTSIKLYLFTYLPFILQKTRGKSWKTAIFSSNFQHYRPLKHQTDLGNTHSNGELLPIITGLAPRSFS